MAAQGGVGGVLVDVVVREVVGQTIADASPARSMTTCTSRRSGRRASGRRHSPAAHTSMPFIVTSEQVSGRPAARVDADDGGTPAPVGVVAERPS